MPCGVRALYEQTGTRRVEKNFTEKVMAVIIIGQEELRRISDSYKSVAGYSKEALKARTEGG